MEPNIWGPPAWTFLHTITFQYPEYPTDLDKQKYYTFFNSLKNVLPCPNCKEHYSENFENIPIRLESREDLIEWLIDIHNEVNKKNNKRIYTYKEVYDIYNKMYDLGESKGNSDYVGMCALILLIIIICYYYYKNFYLKKN
jgi:hypothetical protein